MKPLEARDQGGATPPKRTTVIGVLGGIACGKSAAARWLAGADGELIDADRLAHEELARPEVAARLEARLGAQIRGADGAIDRRALGAIVFADPRALAVLEHELHPRVREEIRRRLERAFEQGLPRVVLDVPLLAEHAAQHGLLERCALLVFVDAPREMRLERARRTRGWTEQEFERREALQMNLERKRALAHYVVPNTGDLAALERSLAHVLTRAGLTPATGRHPR